jgi:hypothetical protein
MIYSTRKIGRAAPPRVGSGREYPCSAPTRQSELFLVRAEQDRRIIRTGHRRGFLREGPASLRRSSRLIDSGISEGLTCVLFDMTSGASGMVSPSSSAAST